MAKQSKRQRNAADDDGDELDHEEIDDPEGSAGAAESEKPEPEAPPRTPELGERVHYVEECPGGAKKVRAAHVIDRSESGTADLNVLTLVPRTSLMPRPFGCRVALGVPYSTSGAVNTWSFPD